MRKHLLRAFAVLMIVLLTIPAYLYYFRPVPTEAAWYSDSWRFRKKITVNSSKVPSTQTDFPVLVSLTDPNLKQFARSDGYDIVFTTSAGSGTKLSHEIESYTASTGKLVAWVKVPTLSSTSNTVIYMYYGNPSSSNQQDVVSTWNDGGSNYFKGVWHFKEDPSANSCSGGQDACDSTTYGNHGNAGGSMTSGDRVTGRIGTGFDFDGSDDVIDAGSATSLDDMMASAGMTLEAWFYPRTLGESSFGRIFHKSSTTSPPGNCWYTFIRTDGAPDYESDLIANFDGSDLERSSSSPAFALNAWSHWALTWDGSTAYNNVHIYLNGSEVSSYHWQANGSGNRLTDAAENLLLGNGVGSSRTWDGILDEMRASATVRSADWIATEYNNQNDPASFLSAGQQEYKSNPVLFLKFDEGNGAITKDTSGNGNNGGIRGASWQTQKSCLSENCLYYDGIDDQVIATNAASIDFDQGMSLGSASAFQAWVKVNSDGENNVGRIFDKGNATYLRVSNEANGKVDLEASLDLTQTDALATV